jgi:uncharacterized protein involved in type VI secretion and phage assembly
MNRLPGVAIGIVKSVDDPRKEGRLQLEFPWMPGGENSAWAPVAAVMSGSNRGFWMMPEVGDEVLVGFEQGDFDHPFVLGFLWNGKDQPPESDAKKRVIVTPGGHTIRFEDGTPKKLIIKSSAGHELLMDDTPGAQKVSLKSAGGSSLVMDDALQSVVLTGGLRTLSMQAGQIKIT